MITSRVRSAYGDEDVWYGHNGHDTETNRAKTIMTIMEAEVGDAEIQERREMRRARHDRDWHMNQVQSNISRALARCCRTDARGRLDQ